ncbi:homoserine dehydrogenase [Dubosiella newyorkensis]|uniref:homoserine dehydrogenase n=1 Tax=Dubosiella newyorkensis TaxID=1862672 RepID=UPI00272FC936|nr:hypothetical protein [Dubosiella newyorkensis]
MNAVLLGYGTVGKGVERLCNQVADLNLTNVFVLPQFEDLPYFTNDGERIVTDPDTDIVFECLSGTEPANTLITKALEAGKHVITSNKAVVSPNLERYVELAKRYGGSIQIEASVAGGIPFLDAILKLQRLEEIDGYEGIFNGTSNYILDQMQKEGVALKDALKEAQKRGYAEADPTNDIEGIDVFYKTNITNMLAYQTKNDAILPPLGISKIDQGNAFASVIAPAFLDEENYLANTPSNYNAQLLFANSFDQLGYFGQGAGQLATAQAMLANALDTMEHRERKIVLNNDKKVDNSILQEDWIVRSKKDLASLMPAKQENEYFLFEKKDPTFIATVQEIDPEAMIALWK